MLKRRSPWKHDLIRRITYTLLVPFDTVPCSQVSPVIKSRCNRQYGIESFPNCWRVWLAKHSSTCQYLKRTLCMDDLQTLLVSCRVCSSSPGRASFGSGEVAWDARGHSDSSPRWLEWKKKRRQGEFCLFGSELTGKPKQNPFHGDAASSDLI